MKKPIKLLYLEGNESDRHAFFRLVHDEGLCYEVTAAETLAEARASLTKSRFDLIVADYHVRDGHAPELFGEVPNTPFVLLTNTFEEQLALRKLGRLADDYLPKDSQGRHLQAIPFAIEKALHRRSPETENQWMRELLQNEELRRLAEEAGEVGSFDYDIQTGEARVSPELLAIYGLEQGSVEPVRDSWLQRVHPDDLGKIESAIQSFKPDGPPWSCEFRIFRPNGEIRWVEARARTIFDSQGNPSRAIGVNVDITDRKKSQEKLRDSEVFYRTLIETLPVTVVLANPEGKVTYISPAAKEMFGLAPEEGLGSLPTDWIAPEHHEIVRRRMRKVMVDLEPQPPIEYKMYRRDRTPIWASLTSAPILDVQGCLKGVITVCENITDRKLAQEAMSESEERFRMALQASTTGWWDWDLATSQVTADAQAKALLGLPPDAEVNSDAILKVLDPGEIPNILVKLSGVFAATNDFDSEFHLIWPDGTSHWVQAKGHAFLDESGQARRLMGLVMDITARKRVEEALQRTITRLELLFEVASQLLTAPKPQEIIEMLCQRIMEHLDCDVFFNFLIDDKSHRLHLNACGGIPAEIAQQIEWLDFGEALCGYAAQERRPIIVENLQQNTNPRTESLRSLGITAYACHPLISRERLIGTLSFGSRRKSAFNQEDLALMRAVSEQVAVAIERRQLVELARQRAAEADAANRAKDHFLAVLSHELRTPLTPVVMGVSMLQDRSDLAPDVRQTLEMIRRNAEMEARLIDDLLDMTRIARGKIELTRRPVELGTVINYAVEVCRPDIEARRLEFGVELGPAAPYWIEADVARLQQVFWNLLKNAIKFTPHGGCVGIHCRRTNGDVVIDVHDSGIGIEPESLSRIFNAFEQEEYSLARQFGGLGLGLAISKTLVEMHGGTIEAHSAGRNKGATFRIRLPLCVPARESELSKSDMSKEHVRRPLRILLVEDHGITAMMMRKVLNAEGHAVETAGDVATALELADKNGFDLLISDLGLPDGSGHELMRELRERRHTFPGIALSGYGQEEDIRRSREVGFAAHLTKPASREAIIEVVASIMAGEQKKAPDDAPQTSQTDAPAFDVGVALKECFGDQDVLAQMIQFFFDDVDKLLPQIHLALRRGDLAEVGRLGHRLKGTIIHLGAEPAKFAAMRVERLMLQGGEQAEAEEAGRIFERECHVLKTALAEHQAAIASTPHEHQG